MNDFIFQAFLTNFKEGDLVLGLANERNVYLNHLKGHLDRTNYRNKHVTPDQFNNKIIPRLIDLEGKYDPHNSYKFDDKHLNDHMAFLLNSGKYSPANDKKDHKKRFDIEEYKYLLACKAAIIKPDSHIHYCLDGINIDAVINKHEDTRKYNSFTSSELRFIFKRRNELKGKVTFYYQGQICAAPWEDPRTKFMWDNFAQSKFVDLYCYEDIYAKDSTAYADKKVPNSAFFRSPIPRLENHSGQASLANVSNSRKKLFIQ